MILEHKHVIP